MNNITRTTITIPENLLEEVKIYAIKNKTSVSKLIQTNLEKIIQTPLKNQKKDLLKLPFVGFHKDKTESSQQIATKLRQEAWYGK